MHLARGVGVACLKEIGGTPILRGKLIDYNRVIELHEVAGSVLKSVVGNLDPLIVAV